LLDQERQVVHVPGLGGTQSLEISGQVDVQPPDSWDRSSNLSASFAVNIAAIQLKPGAAYSWSFEVDGKEEARADFLVRST
jgi:hypothetical protein